MKGGRRWRKRGEDREEGRRERGQGGGGLEGRRYDTVPPNQHLRLP